jgi:hypothetical protein
MLPDFLAAVSWLVVVRHPDAHRQGSPCRCRGHRPARPGPPPRRSPRCRSPPPRRARRLGGCPGSQQGGTPGGLACSKQQCRALATAPTVRLLSGLNWHQASTTSTGNRPDFHPGTGRPTGTQTTAMCCQGRSLGVASASGVSRGQAARVRSATAPEPSKSLVNKGSVGWWAGRCSAWWRDMGLGLRYERR